MDIITTVGEKCCFGSAFLKFSSSSSLSYPPTQYPLNVCDSGHLMRLDPQAAWASGEGTRD